MLPSLIPLPTSPTSLYLAPKVNVAIPEIVTVYPPGPPSVNPNIVPPPSPHAAVSVPKVSTYFLSNSAAFVVALTPEVFVGIPVVLITTVEMKVLKGVALAL
jgi:hypothetical protein